MSGGGLGAVDPIGATAVLDACVLAQMAAREAFFAFAEAGLFRPRWSPRIQAEWRAAAMKPGRGLEAASIDGDIALAALRLPDALYGDAAEIERIEATLSLPDWNDRHVLAAAIAVEADLIITDNLRDFPRRRLAGHGLLAISADAYAAEIAGRADDAPLVQALNALAASAAGRLTLAELPAKLKSARLPRFAKAVARRVVA